MTEVLVIDDDKTLCSMLTSRIESAGYTAIFTHSLADGFHLAETGNYDIILLDVALPDGNGLDYLTHFLSVLSAPEIIIMTGAGDTRGAEKAIKSGAWGYLEKPHIIRDLLLPLTRAIEYRKNKSNVPDIEVALNRQNIIGKSAAITRSLDQLAAASTSEVSVLITGQTGTGKEVFARALHENSSRANKPFVVVDCAALPESLIESTLFGHTKGAFTGASDTRQGLIKLADGGTLFLDEVGELPVEVQKKFLRVLQEGTYRSVGGTKEVTSDFRLVAATNRNLDIMVENGQFRADLLFRLRAIPLQLPTLQERPEDIPDLASHIARQLCAQLHIEPKKLSDDFLEVLQAYDWPGNVRELTQLLRGVFTQHRHDHTLFSYHLPEHIRIYQAQRMLDNRSVQEEPEWDRKHKPHHEQFHIRRPLPWKEHKAAMEKEYIEQLMAYTSGSIAQAVTVSGLSRARIYQLLSKTKNRQSSSSPPGTQPCAMKSDEVD